MEMQFQTSACGNYLSVFTDLRSSVSKWELLWLPWVSYVWRPLSLSSRKPPERARRWCSICILLTSSVLTTAHFSSEVCKGGPKSACWLFLEPAAVSSGCMKQALELEQLCAWLPKSCECGAVDCCHKEMAPGSILKTSVIPTVVTATCQQAYFYIVKLY